MFTTTLCFQRLTLVGFASLALASTHAWAIGPGFALDVTPAHQVVEPGAAANLTLARRNLSSEAQSLNVSLNGPDAAEFNCKLRIHDQHGDEPKLTEYGNELYGIHPHTVLSVGASGVTVPPGGTYVEHLDVNKLYHLLPHHAYSVSVIYAARAVGMTEPLVSKWVSINVK